MLIGLCHRDPLESAMKFAQTEWDFMQEKMAGMQQLRLANTTCAFLVA